MRKKLISIILAIAMLACMIPLGALTAFAVPVDLSQYDWEGVVGDGTEGNPYKIGSKDDLEKLAKIVTDEENNCADTYFVLTDNIGSTNDPVTTVIGSQANIFKGHFNGNGHTVTVNLTGVSNYFALFSVLGNGGEIINLTTAGCVPGEGNEFSGGVCGQNNGTIANCCNTAEVSGYEYVGGVCGQNSGTITNCYNTAEVSGDNTVGGVCGYNIATVTDCYNTAKVSGYEYVGGVCGENDSTMTNCYNTAEVNGGEGSSRVGGVCGFNYGTIANCYHTGAVSGDVKVGGVCGENHATIINCYYNIDVYSGGTVGSDTAATASYGLPTEQMQAASKAVLTTSVANNKPLVDLLNEYVNNNLSAGLKSWTNKQGEYPVFVTPHTHSFTGEYVIGTGDNAGKHGQKCSCGEVGNWVAHDFTNGDCVCGEVYLSDRTMNMGSGVIAVKDNIYYGNQKKFRVLSTNGNTTKNGQTTETATYYIDGSENPITPSEGPLFVISENNFSKRAFDTSDKSVWANSSSKTWCNGDFYTAAGITDTEKTTILTTSKTDAEYSYYNATSINDKVFYLSANEAETYLRNDIQFKPDGGETAVYWWLRSNYDDNDPGVGLVDGSGTLTFLDARYTSPASRPAFNLNLSSVLFTSAADFNGTIGTYSGNEWKLTLKDSTRNNFTASSQSRTGNVVTVAYTNAVANENVSCIITDKDQKEIKYYATSEVTSVNGTADLTIPETIGENDKMLVFSEQVNGARKTNYASELKEVTIPAPHTHSFTGEYVSNSDGTYSRKCTGCDEVDTVNKITATDYHILNKTCETNDSKGAKMGHQDKNGETGVGRAIICLTQADLEKITEDTVTVVGGDKGKQATFTLDCAYTYFYAGDTKYEAKDMSCAAFLIIDHDALGEAISGYGYYAVYNGDLEKLIVDALFRDPVKTVSFKNVDGHDYYPIFDQVPEGVHFFTADGFECFEMTNDIAYAKVISDNAVIHTVRNVEASWDDVFVDNDDTYPYDANVSDDFKSKMLLSGESVATFTGDQEIRETPPTVNDVDINVISNMIFGQSNGASFWSNTICSDRNAFCFDCGFSFWKQSSINESLNVLICRDF